MWLVLLELFALAALAQLGFIADTLNKQEDGSVVNPPWLAVFIPLILYLLALFVWVLVTCWSAGSTWLNASGTVLLLDEPSSSSDPDALDEVYVHRDAVVHYRAGGATATVSASGLFFEGFVYSIVLVTLSFFVALLIDQLYRLDDAIADNEHMWTLVLAPLLLLLIFLFFLFGFVGLRVCGEERFQRAVANGEVFTAACGGVLVCCAPNYGQIAVGDQYRYEKRPAYLADRAFHSLPCVFMCTPAMTYGVADLLLSWLYFLLLPVLFFVLLYIGVSLDATGTVSLALAFFALYLLEALFIAAALALAVTLCAYWNHVNVRPRGRGSLRAKYTEAFFTIVAAILLIVFQVLLAWRVDDLGPTELDWHTIFIPLYILLVFAIILGICYKKCCVRRVTIAAPAAAGVIETGKQQAPTAPPLPRVPSTAAPARAQRH